MRLHHHVANALGYDLIRQKKSHHRLDLHLSQLIKKYHITDILDVGANHGQFALSLRELSFAGRIYSFEPIDKEFNHLAQLAAKDAKWSVEHCALGAVEESLPLNITDSTDLSSFLIPNAFCKSHFKHKATTTSRLNVPIKTLNNFISANNLAEKKILLKTDTQGYDLEVLKGAGNYLASSICIVLAELSFKPIYDGMSSALETIGMLKSHGFNPSGFFIISRDKKTLEVIEMDGVFINNKFSLIETRSADD